MSSINSHISIPKNVATKDDLDFFHLRDLGISHIETFGRKLWTDFNTHDPGITILDMLAYAITDLGMRIEMPIENLLASDDPSKALNKQFYKASEIFPSKAVNELDYRKIFIDIEGVKNCWLRKHNKEVYLDCLGEELFYDKTKYDALDTGHRKEFKLNGLYDLLVDFDEFDDSLTDAQIIDKQNEIIEAIRVKYHDNRNLCEDLVKVTKVQEKSIAVCASIEVENEIDEEYVHAQVLRAIEKYFSPELKFYTIEEMLGKGYTTDVIFDGPLLDNGFIDIEELKEAEIRRQVRLSDIMKLIMNIEGVKLIKDISIGYCDGTDTSKDKWVLCPGENIKPILCKESAFTYSKGVLPLNINENQLNAYLEDIKKEEKLAQEAAKTEKFLEFPKGVDAFSQEYTTIQNDFPDTYKIGQEGLSKNASDERKVQAKQLKAYLLFFDKILASYFQHLSKVKELLSINGNHTKTFFTQAIKDVKGFEELVNEYPSDEEQLTEQLFKDFDDNIVRRNQILDHLLGRFAERFGEYAFLMKTLYGSATDEVVLENKEQFLNDYIAISSERGCAFNYTKAPEDLWDTNNVSGVQKRVSRLVGIRNYNRRDLTGLFVQVYELQNASNETVYRWRIRNEEGNIILSATDDYPTVDKATDEMYFAILQIVQTRVSEVHRVFEENPDLDEKLIDNLRIHISNSGKLSFDVINPLEPSSSSDHIIAKQFKYYNTREEILEAILSIIDFMKYKFTEEGIFLVEHILLRPDVTQKEPYPPKEHFMHVCADDCKDDCNLDPYSYRVSIVIPGYTYRFSNPDFRNYMENIIKEELPAHILPKICWVGDRLDIVPDEENDLFCFERDFKKFLFAKTDLPHQEQPSDELIQLIDTLSKLNTIYPTGRLLDCDDESDELEGRIILGQTNLGTL